MNIGFLSGAYPPLVDGIGDFTRLIARETADRHKVTVFTAHQNSHTADNGVAVRGVFDPRKPSTIRQLARTVPVDQPMVRLTVQYNPFGFGPRGFNPWLPGVLVRLRKQWHCHIAVMFHETYVPPESLRFRAMRLWQIPQFLALCRVSDSLFASTGRWIPPIRSASGKEPLLLPAGSNVSRSLLSREDARNKLSIPPDAQVLVVFGSAHPSRLLEWIARAAREARATVPNTVLLYIGADGEKIRTSLDSNFPFIDCGVRPDTEVGDCLAAGNLMLAPFSDGLSTRRGSVVAAFQHGLPVLSTLSSWTDSLLREQPGIFLSPLNEGPSGFAAKAARLTSTLTGEPFRQLEIFYETNFSWPVLSARMCGDRPPEHVREGA